MKRRRFSLRDQQYVQEVTLRLCQQLGLTGRYAAAADWAVIGWECFLEVYYRRPSSFSGSGTQGWNSVSDAIRERLLAEKSALQREFFQQWSLDAPVSDENDEPRTELLHFSVGDCVNTVCLYDYLNRLSPRAPDAVFLANRLILGDTEEEIYRFYHWSQERYQNAFRLLRAAMEEYEMI